MLIIAAGMFRSASTWHYQVACELAQRIGPWEFLGYKHWDDFTPEMAEAARGERIFVVKTHPGHDLMRELAAEGHAKVLYSYRDVRDVVYSLAHKLLTTPDDVIARLLPITLEAHEFWTSCPGLHSTRYEDFVRGPRPFLRSIARFLNVRLTPDDVVRLDSQFSHEANRQRAETTRRSLEAQGCDLADLKYTCLYGHDQLVHWNHLRSGDVGQWRQIARQPELQALQHVVGQWLVENGYELHQHWADSPGDSISPPFPTAVLRRAA